jgi:hypothetical protein
MCGNSKAMLLQRALSVFTDDLLRALESLRKIFSGGSSAVAGPHTAFRGAHLAPELMRVA